MKIRACDCCTPDAVAARERWAQRRMHEDAFRRLFENDRRYLIVDLTYEGSETERLKGVRP